MTGDGEVRRLKSPITKRQNYCRPERSRGTHSKLLDYKDKVKGRFLDARNDN